MSPALAVRLLTGLLAGLLLTVSAAGQSAPFGQPRDLWVAVDVDAPEAVLRDAISGKVPRLAWGNPLRVHLAFFRGADLVTDFEELETLYLEADLAQTDAADEPLVLEDLPAGSLDDTLTGAEWTARTNEHALITLTAAQMQLTMEGRRERPVWLAVHAARDDDAPALLGMGRAVVYATNAFPTDTPPPDFDPPYPTPTEIEARWLPTGGTTGQVLRKTSGTDYAVEWGTVAGGSGSGDLLAANNLSDLANAATARTNLGLAIGTQVQAYDADLVTLAGNNGANLTGLSGSAIASGTVADARIAATITRDSEWDTVAEINAGLTDGREIVTTDLSFPTGGLNAAEDLVVIYDTSLGFAGLVAANSWPTVAQVAAAYQPLDAELTALSGLTSAANRIPYYTGSGTADLLDSTTLATLSGSQTLTNKTLGQPVVSNGTTSAGALILREDGDAGFDGVTVTVPATLSASYSLTLPTTDGDADQVLTTNGAGVTSWGTPAGGGNVSDGDTLAAGLTFPQSGLKVEDATGDALTITTDSEMNADRTFTLQPGDNDRTLNIADANVTITTAGAALVDDVDAEAMRSTLALVPGTNVLSHVAPGTAGNVLTSNGSAWTSSAPSGGGPTIARTTADQDITATALADVTTLNYSLAAGEQIEFTAYLRIVGSAATEAPRPSVNGPAGVSYVTAQAAWSYALTTTQTAPLLAYETVPGFTQSTTTESLCIVAGTIINGGTAGTFTIRCGTETASGGAKVTIKAGSSLVVHSE